MSKDWHYMTDDEMFTEFILAFGRAVDEVTTSQQDLADSQDAEPGDRELVNVFKALPDVLKKHPDVLRELYKVYADQRFID